TTSDDRTFTTANESVSLDQRKKKTKRVELDSVGSPTRTLTKLFIGSTWESIKMLSCGFGSCQMRNGLSSETIAGMKGAPSSLAAWRRAVMALRNVAVDARIFFAATARSFAKSARSAL